MRAIRVHETGGPEMLRYDEAVVGQILAATAHHPVFLQHLLGRLVEDPGPLTGHPPAALRRRLVRALTAGLLVTAAGVWAAAALSLREGHRSRFSAVAVGAAILVALLSVAAPGLASALLILLLGFAAGSRILAALGILSLLGFVTHFYYGLHATLLEKSAILAATGLCLLAACFLLRRFSPPAEATDSAHA